MSTDVGRRFERNAEAFAHVMRVQDQLQAATREEVFRRGDLHLGAAANYRSNVWPGVSDDRGEDSRRDFQRLNELRWRRVGTDRIDGTHVGIRVLLPRRQEERRGKYAVNRVVCRL